MTPDEMIAIIQAHKDGKIIEFRTKRGNDSWTVTINPQWNFTNFDYRIKPEPHYRPFKTAEEVMEAIRKYGNWVKLKNTDLYKIISAFKGNMIYLGASRSGDPTDIIMREYTFADENETPFGILEN